MLTYIKQSKINELLKQHKIEMTNLIDYSISLNNSKIYFNIAKYIDNAPINILLQALINTNDSMYIYFFSMYIKNTQKNLIIDYFLSKIDIYKGLYINNLITNKKITIEELENKIIELNSPKIAYYSTQYIQGINKNKINHAFPIITTNEFITKIKEKDSNNKQKKKRKLKSIKRIWFE